MNDRWTSLGVDEELNSLPHSELVNLYHDGKVGMYVDRVYAFKAAGQGVHVSSITPILALSVPLLLIGAVIFAIFYSWLFSAVLVFAAIAFFSISRRMTISEVRAQLLLNEKLFEVFRKNGAVWFE